MKGRVSIRKGGGGYNVAISVFKNAHYARLSKQLARARARAWRRARNVRKKSRLWPYWRLLTEARELQRH